MLIAPLQPWANRGQRACDRQRSTLQQPQRTVGCICDYESNLSHESNLALDYEMHLRYKIRQPRSLRACSRDDPECGARRGVLRRRLVTARPGRPGTPPARHYDLAARSSLHGSGGNAGDGSAAPEDRKSTRLNSSHVRISYAVFCLKKKKKHNNVLIYTKKKNKKTKI